MSDKDNTDKDSLAFDDWVVKGLQSDRLARIIPERLRTQVSVTLFKRNRGETLGDRIGRWNYQTQNYVEPVINVLQPYNIYTKNIVKKIVRANASTMSQATIAITAEPRMQDTKAKKNALITSKVCDWIDDDSNGVWTTSQLLHLNELKQLTQGVFLRTYWDDSAEGKEYDEEEWSEEPFDLPAHAACAGCGESQVVRPDAMTQAQTDPEAAEDAMSDVDGDAQLDPCQACGGQMQIIEPGETVMLDIPKTVKKRYHGEIALEIRPSMEFRVDEQNSQGGNLSKCKWMDHHPLMTRFEIENRFKIKDIGEPTTWDYPMQWLYTLQSGTSFPFKTTRMTQDTIRKLSLYQVNYRYFTPAQLSSYTAEKDFEFKKDGKVIFSIKKDQCARDVVLEMAKADAQERKSPVMKNGLCVVIIGDKVRDIYLADFKQEFGYTYFVSDPVSFWAMAYAELESMQHLVNQTLTAIGNQVTSNQNVLIVDRDAYDADDVEGSKNVIYTREGLDKPIPETFGFMPATPVTADSWRMVDWADESANEIGMASREMQGQPSTATTYKGAQLNRDQSVGVLTPAQQSTAAAKVTVFQQAVLLAQEHWPPQRLKELCDTTDGIITDEDIETWYKSNLLADVIFSYRPGSEMPKSFSEKRDDIGQITSYIANLAGVVPNLMTPQLATELIDRFAGYSSLDGIDIQNAEIDTEVAEIRYDIIVDGLENAMQSGLAMTDPNADPQMMEQMVLGKVMANPILFPLKQENHVVAAEFYRDKCLYEYKKEQPDLLLIAGCQQMIQRHNDALIDEGQTVVKTKMAIEQPMQEQQMAIQGQQAAAADQQNAATAQTDQQKMMVDAAMQQNAHNLEREKIAAENERTKVGADTQIAQKVLELAHNAQTQSNQGNQNG